MLDDSFDALGQSLDRLAASDAMNTAAVLNAIDAMRAEFEERTAELHADLERRNSGLSGCAVAIDAPGAGLQATTDRILELLAELAAKKAAEGA
jgi:hypothetical protein